MDQSSYANSNEAIRPIKISISSGIKTRWPRDDLIGDESRSMEGQQEMQSDFRRTRFHLNSERYVNVGIDRSEIPKRSETIGEIGGTWTGDFGRKVEGR